MKTPAILTSITSSLRSAHCIYKIAPRVMNTVNELTRSVKYDATELDMHFIGFTVNRLGVCLFHEVGLSRCIKHGSTLKEVCTMAN